MESTYENIELSPTTRTIPFSAAHSKRKSQRQHQFMKVIVIKSKYFYRGKDNTFIMHNDLCVRNVRKLRFHSFGKCLQREVSWVHTCGYVHVCIQLASAYSQEAP